MDTNAFLAQKYKITVDALNFVKKAEEDLKEVFAGFDETASFNTYKVLHAFKEANVQNRHFVGTTGYGYSDEGREKLGELFAQIFGAEAAFVSPQIASGTHAITIALFGLLRPLDTMLSITGKPYDTLAQVIGIGNNKASGSLADFAIKYQQVDLLPDSKINIQAVLDNLYLNKSIKMVYIQRSRGYEMRKSLTIAQIAEAIKAVKAKFPKMKVVVDNCYGEFTEDLEPTDVGADLMIGSLIKNPGGGLAPTGAYLAGTKECVDMAAGRLTCPGIGTEVGSYAYGYLPYYQGIYFAPSVVRNALKGAALTAYTYEKLGYKVLPRYNEPHPDITQAICMESETGLINLVRAVQKSSPVDANVVPYPWDMPGYEDPVIMAAGTFVQGGSIELSADGPVKPPYITYMQGGLTYENTKLAILCALSEMDLDMD